MVLLFLGRKLYSVTEVVCFPRSGNPQGMLRSPSRHAEDYRADCEDRIWRRPALADGCVQD